MDASAPTSKRQNPCFITGNVALPAEVADTVQALASVITCDTSVSCSLRLHPIRRADSIPDLCILMLWRDWADKYGVVTMALTDGSDDWCT